MDNLDNILIVGAGSIGALMGAALIKAGLKITFAGKPNSSYTQTLKQQGLQLQYADGESLWISPLHPKVRFVDTATDLQQKFDLIIIALKSNHLTEVISYIQAHANSQTILVHAQNGIPYWWFNCDRYLASLNKNILHGLSPHSYLNSVDPRGVLYRTLDKFTSVGCVVKAPCQKDSQGKIQVKKAPQIILGLTKQKHHNHQQQATIQHLSSLFNQYGVNARYTEKIRTAVCNKLAINLTTNVLSALTGKVIAELTANDSTNSLIKTVIAEINHVFTHYGIQPEDLSTKAQIYAYIKAPGSQSHLPSLAQDFAQHKLGEVSLITAPVEMAKIAQLEVPTLCSLSKLLQLAQTYSLRRSNHKSHILTLDHYSGYCMLTKEVCESSVVNSYQIPNLLTHLLQVNVSTLNR
jgi:2-dehydropantoate 2-reductase